MVYCYGLNLSYKIKTTKNQIIMIPQLIYLAMVCLGLGIAFAQHGTIRKATTHNAWVSVFGTAVVMVILYYGGFFHPLFK